MFALSTFVFLWLIEFWIFYFWVPYKLLHSKILNYFSKSVSFLNLLLENFNSHGFPVETSTVQQSAHMSSSKHHHLRACDAFFGRWWQWKLDAGIRRYDLTQQSCNFPAISWKMDLFSAAMSHGNEGKQVVLLLEYGLNGVPSFICLVIEHIFLLSPFLHAVCDVPSRVRLAKHGERRNLL